MCELFAMSAGQHYTAQDYLPRFADNARANMSGWGIGFFREGQVHIEKSCEGIYVVGLVSFLAEIGVKPVLCASGGRSGRLAAAVAEVTGDLLPEPPVVKEGMDFYEIAAEAEALAPDLLVGHSKGYHLAKRWQVPLVRVGFPIHDRFGGPRILHLGYRGAQNLLDRIVNAMIERKQETSPVGYGYM